MHSWEMTQARPGHGDNGDHDIRGCGIAQDGATWPDAQAGAARMSARPRRRRWLRRLLMLPVLLVAFSVLQVLVLRFVDPPLSMVMVEHRVAAWIDGDRDFRIRYRWRDMDRIAPALPLAAIAAEDQRFASHRGIDPDAAEKAPRPPA